MITQKATSETIVKDRSCRDAQDYKVSYKLIRQYCPELGEVAFANVEKQVFRHLDCLKQTFPDLSELTGLRIIDLACGSRYWGGNFDCKFDPWMSRILVECGAKPLGLDICEQARENFESRVVDLSKPEALSFLESKSFDSYYINAFPTSTFLSVLTRRGYHWSQIKDNILYNLNRSLKEGSKIIQGFIESNESFIRKVTLEQFSQVNDAEL